MAPRIVLKEGIKSGSEWLELSATDKQSKKCHWSSIRMEMAWDHPILGDNGRNIKWYTSNLSFRVKYYQWMRFSLLGLGFWQPGGSLSLRVENRPSVLGIFIYVPWGGVGWGNNVHVLAHSHDVTPRHVHLHVRTYVMLRWKCVTSRRGGVGWGGAITFMYLRTPMMLRHGTFTCTCARTWCYDQLTSCPENEQELNDLIWTYVRTWQWQWEANVVGKALLEKTGAYWAKM